MRIIFALLSILLSMSAAAGYIHQTVDASCNWTTKRADGTVLSTAASLQPGIDEAQASGHPLIVDGRRACPITVSTTTIFGPSNGASYTLRNVYLSSTATPVVKIDTFYVSALDWRNGAISYTGPSAPYPSSVVQITPSGPVPGAGPDEPYPITKFGEITLPKINAYGGQIHTVVLFSQPHTAIVNTRFKFQHVNAFCSAANGITVFNPTDDTSISAFGQNIIDFGLVDAFLSVGIQEGNGPRSAPTPLGTNIWTGAITASCQWTVYAAVVTFGLLSQYYLSSISVNAGGLLYGVLFGSGAVDNYVVTPQIQGATNHCWPAGNGNKCVTPPY